jgi:Domain of unknown function (DUF4328)
MADAAIPTPPAVKTTIYKPRNPSGLAQVLLIALYVDLGIDALGLVTDGVHLTFLIGGDSEQRAVDMILALSNLLQAMVFLVAGFLSLKWIYRMSLNAHALAPDLKTTPAWGIGWFFVPFASLWKPYQGVRESWQVSAAGGPGWQSQPVPPLLRWWWLLWVGANILGNLAFRLQADSSSTGEITAGAWVSVAQDVANLPLDVLFILVVQRLTALQVGALSGRVFD